MAKKASKKATQKAAPKSTKKSAQKASEHAKVPAERPGQPGGRRDTNRKERIKGLTDAALKLFLERGIEAVTIEDITGGADVAKGSFYRYFADKTALVETLFLPIYDAVRTSFDESLAAIEKATTKEEGAASYDVLAAGLISIILHHGDAVLLYLQENRGAGGGARQPVVRLRALIAEKAVEHTARARAFGLLKPFAPELSTLVVIGAAENLLHAALSGNLQAEPFEVPGQLISLMMDGIRAPDGGLSA
jgi:AcrR family transcriptional regulator